MNTICTSACGNDYDCPHEEQFNEVKLRVQHLPSDYPKENVYADMAHLIIEAMNDQEAKHGEERVPAND